MSGLTIVKPRWPPRILLTSFGYNDSGGGTTVPRLAAKELARRGWEVTVFHAAVKPRRRHSAAYHVAEWEEDGVRLVGVHNRPHGLWDREQPLRELDDPPITAAFARRAGPRRARRRPLPQPPQPRRGADRPDRRARDPELVHDAQLLADLPARLPDDGRRRRSAPAPATGAAARRAPAGPTRTTTRAGWRRSARASRAG